ncbi:MAG: arginine--tRNA ligase [Alphaproteobacteria bacterium]|nr:arginine--tRNA ligase [Alphaproteobacteria bacterium]
MNYFNKLRDDIAAVVAAVGLPGAAFAVEPARDPAHGDVATNVAMILSKVAGRPPKELADLMISGLKAIDGVASADVAGPGFINFRLSSGFWLAQLQQILKSGLDYGRCDLGQGAKVNIEYVSANPTGPLHVGHARGSVFGDVLANLMESVGYHVVREYYINDAGAQVDALARSLHWRYREALGEALGDLPSGLYPGDYLRDAARELIANAGSRWLAVPEDDWLPPLRLYAIDAMMTLIRNDLLELGVGQSVFSSEHALVARGGVDEALAYLAEHGLIYQGVLEPPKGKKPEDWEPREQTLFRATQFGDDVDRPLRKSDGTWTYFAGDVAYHFDKIRRGFAVLIDVWGADHSGYIKRMQAAVKAMSEGRVPLDIKICQLVNLLDQGQPLKMSKRAGRFVTLRDVVDAVGKDVVRFMMVTRRNDVPLDFDLAKVREQSKDNPVFYVQYAHARCCSVLRNAQEAFPNVPFEPAALGAAPLTRLGDPGELRLIRALAGWPRTVEGAAQAHEPHRLAFYLFELASEFHAHWHRGNDDPGLRFIIAGDPDLTAARLGLVHAVRFVIAGGLRIFGVEAATEMH